MFTEYPVKLKLLFEIKVRDLLKYFIYILFTLNTLSCFTQNVLLKGKTVSYYSKKKIKEVKIQTSIDSLILGEYISKGTFKIPINRKGIVKIAFIKEGYIDKFFLINTQGIPNYNLNKKYTIKADVSIIKFDKYMDDNEIENAVGYAYFNKKYDGFVWDPEYTKKAQIAMDATVFPLEEVVQLDSVLNPKGTIVYFRNGLNYYVNLNLKEEQIFKEALNLNSKSPIKAPVIKGYLYGKFMYYLIENNLDSINHISKLIFPEKEAYNTINEGIKDCKYLDTLILKNKFSAIGYWIHLVNTADSEDLDAYAKLAVLIKTIEKHFVSLSLTDAELSFLSDIQNTTKRAIQFEQIVSSLSVHEKKSSKYCIDALNTFKDQVRILSKNCELY